MKKIILALIMLLLSSTPCMAKWEKRDTALLVLRVVDWQQTRVIATQKCLPGWYNWDDKSVYEYSEVNPLLGRHPSLEAVDGYFIALITVDILIALFGPGWLHYTWNGLQITGEVYCVGRNYNVGIRLRF